MESRIWRVGIARRMYVCFASSWSRLDMPSHWNGVWGLGTKFETLTCTLKRPPRPLISRPISRARMPRSTMPWTSAWVSRGRPIMKYVLRLV